MLCRDAILLFPLPELSYLSDWKDASALILLLKKLKFMMAEK